MTKSATIWRPRSGTGDVSTSTSVEALLTQVSDTLITESGDTLILTATTVTAKADTAWDSQSKNATAWWDTGYGDVSSIATTDRYTEAGDTRITESGDTRILESTEVTPKRATVWSDA